MLLLGKSSDTDTTLAFRLAYGCGEDGVKLSVGVYFRPFVPDPMEESVIPSPERGLVRYHDVSELSTSQQVSYSTLERPKEGTAEVMYCRPGFDNVPSY